MGLPTFTQVDGVVNLQVAWKATPEHACQHPSGHGEYLIVQHIEGVGLVPRFKSLQVDTQAKGLGFPSHPMQGNVG